MHGGKDSDQVESPVADSRESVASHWTRVPVTGVRGNDGNHLAGQSGEFSLVKISIHNLGECPGIAFIPHPGDRRRTNRRNSGHIHLEFELKHEDGSQLESIKFERY